jgi:hypothetical protein
MHQPLHAAATAFPPRPAVAPVGEATGLTPETARLVEDWERSRAEYTRLLAARGLTPEKLERLARRLLAANPRLKAEVDRQLAEIASLAGPPQRPARPLPSRPIIPGAGALRA